ncbi:zinc ABC transporter substrate-binding protein [Shewanella sp. 1_MG-2023]|uniref:metal ABC transporter solute-binding protein, Zn/Mn family n=1 Tax=unclassified Shewanella TaxID=196818 RepID=UPI0026E1595A|nr:MULTISPECIES: zinc ABC transporter substrate-binding protein [unclassified Shewanella]MDO6611192.1 zinc ABC transporter substrate-binding protein [Shewanella sp. 7_MG-2023]MDO6770931.1 zinc ABC transporter substrate-binding protein [Shewanella sp. 2_MG-2023]MDO6794682.1 zinc ABC transporter substrate-binding protein [Shewanella sp. 1_MG-2023]
MGALCSAFLTSAANAQLNVFACEPEYAALAQEIAPEAKIYSATSAMQDPHLVQARPSLIAKMRQADLVVCAGADLEIGWLPMLQMKASNNKVRSTDNGLFYAAEHIDTLDKLEYVDRSMGDVHAKGNPHLHFDPRRMLQVANALSEKMTALDPEGAAGYQAKLTDFTDRWQQAIPKWEEQAAGLKGKKVIAYHSSFRYLFNWLGIEQVADLEPKPGIPPSSSHLAKLVNRSQEGDVMAILVTSYQDERGANWLGERTDLPVLILPMSVGGNSDSTDLFSLYDSVITMLTEVQ